MNKNNIKDYSRKISECMWNLPDKGELDARRTYGRRKRNNRI